MQVSFEFLGRQLKKNTKKQTWSWIVKYSRIVGVFNNRQYYNVRWSSNEQDAWAAESRKPFCTLDISLDTQNTEKQTEREWNITLQQFANLNSGHLVQFEVLKAQPKADGNVAVMF